MKILVTGGAGFIGSAVARQFIREGHDVTIVDDFSSGHWSNLIPFAGNVVTLSLPGEASRLLGLRRFDIISHQASITDTTVMDQRLMMTNNVEGFRAVLEAAAEWKSRVVWASSASIYGQGHPPMVETQPPQPLNVYAYSKLAMERLAVRFGPRLAQPIVGLRYFNVYGPGEDHKGKFASMIHQLAKQMRAGERPRIFTAGQQKRDFVSVEDVVQANMKALECAQGGIFNVGSGQAASFNEVVRELNRALKTDLPPDYFENPYSFTQDCTQADLTSSKSVLKYMPQYDLRRGIDAYLESGKLGTGA